MGFIVPAAVMWRGWLIRRASISLRGASFSPSNAVHGRHLRASYRPKLALRGVQ